MGKFKYKSAVELEYDAGKKRLRAEANIALASLLNDALDTYTKRFNASVAKGALPRVTFGPGEVRELLLASAKRELSPPVEAEGKDVTDAGD